VVSGFRRAVNDICTLLGQWQSPLEWEQIQVLSAKGNPVLAAPPRKGGGTTTAGQGNTRPLPG